MHRRMGRWVNFGSISLKRRNLSFYCRLSDWVFSFSVHTAYYGCKAFRRFIPVTISRHLKIGVVITSLSKYYANFATYNMQAKCSHGEFLFDIAGGSRTQPIYGELEDLREPRPDTYT